MKILHKDDGKTGLFYVETDGSILAEMSYIWTSPDVITINHTEVDDVLKGTGIGKQLAQKAVDMAREQHL